jgi:hypothetical protein
VRTVGSIGYGPTFSTTPATLRNPNAITSYRAMAVMFEILSLIADRAAG